jgi:hypothetical protein
LSAFCELSEPFEKIDLKTISSRGLRIRHCFLLIIV